MPSDDIRPTREDLVRLLSNFRKALMITPLDRVGGYGAYCEVRGHIEDALKVLEGRE